MRSVQAPQLSATPRDELHAIDELAAQPKALSHQQPSLHDQMQTLSHFAREQLARRWAATHAQDAAAKPKRVYYLSMEFLMGRSLSPPFDMY